MIPQTIGGPIVRHISIALLAWLSCLCSALAADNVAQPPHLGLPNLKVGDVGMLPPAFDAARIRPSCESRIEWKVADNYFVMDAQCYDVVQSVGENGSPAPPVLQKAGHYYVVIRGVSIANRNEGEKIQLEGSFRVVGIEKKIKSAQPTLYVLEPAAPPPAKKP